MSASDRTDPPAEDNAEAGNFVNPVDHGDGGGTDLGTDAGSDKGDFTSSTDFGAGQTAEPNVDRPDGDYTTGTYTGSETHSDDSTGEGEYTDRGGAG